MISGRHIKIALLQDVPGTGIRKAFYRVLENTQPDIIAFPEYYFVQPDDDNVLDSCFWRDQILSCLKTWSTEFHCLIIGGSLVEKDEHGIRNRCYLFNNGELFGHYDKIHPLDKEGRGLISAGSEYKVFEYRGFRIGILICADVLHPQSFANIRGLTPELIFIPTTSPYKDGESHRAKFARDMTIFAAGAEISRSIIIKVNASGSIAGHRLQGRSLIASPGRILWRVEPENEDKSALAVVELTYDLLNPLLDITVHQP
jgi:predicted amidohydrolase